MINRRVHSLDEPEAFAIATRLTAQGQEEGAIPRDRAPLTGCEDAFFAYEGGTVVGCAVFWNPEGRPFLYLDILFVAPEHRRRGLGAGLLDAVAAEAAELGLTEIHFGTMLANAPMQALGRKAGFETKYVVMVRTLVGAGV